jgi:hypothetical protein
MSAASSEAAARRHIVVVIAALDEASNIEVIYERLRRVVLALPDTRSEFIGWLRGPTGPRRF